MAIPPGPGIRGKLPQGENHSEESTLIICDFDGTICSVDMGNMILNRFTEESWQDIDDSFVKGEIGSRVAYARIAKMLKGGRREMTEFVARHGTIDPGFRDFYGFCRNRGIDVIIVSDGLDFYISAIMELNGLSGIKYYSNRVTFGNNGSMRISFPHARETCGKCGTCKRFLLESCRDSYRRICYVGNGLSDVCPSGDADLVFAKDILWEKCIERGTKCIQYDNFHDVQRHLVELL
jgi:2-hydroxy-3-keto-5-methylthiopentenyl-1-phosphate phosphatase